MSTQSAAHLNFNPADTLPSAPEESQSTAALLRQQAAERLAAHRERRGASRQAAVVSQPRVASGKAASVAAAVAARYAKAQTYRDFLASEAEEAVRRAEAAAEVAARNAEAIVAAQQELLRELEQHNLVHEPNFVHEIAQWNGDSTAIAEHIAETATALELLPALEESSSTAIPDPVGIVVEHFTPTQVGSSPDFAAVPEIAAAFAFEPHEPVAPLPANLIEFPRVLVASRKARPRLAEGPLREKADAESTQLRIFEVDSQALSPQPAQSSVMPEWSSIRLDAAVPAHAVEHPQTPAAYTIPVQTAALGPRVTAVAIDTAITAAATLLFAGVFAAMAHHTGVMPEMKAAAIAFVAVFFLFKLAYQVLFFSLNEATPGMRKARIALCTFNDDNPTRKALRLRIGATVLAACPMGLGLVWGWFDVDRLGWHDRMTRTYQRSY